VCVCVCNDTCVINYFLPLMDSGPDVKKLSNVLHVTQAMTYLFVSEMLMTLVLCPKHRTLLDGDGFLWTIHMTKNDVLTN
jgi:hypothetical protein